MSIVSTSDRGANNSAKARGMRQRARQNHSTSVGYCPFPLDTDPEHFGLTTGSIDTSAGPVVVRHGRRTTTGTATILLHGGAGSWTTWTPLLSAADSAAAEDASATTLKDLVIPDLPGWGDTPLPPDAESLTVELMADAIVEIARSLGYD